MEFTNLPPFFLLASLKPFSAFLLFKPPPPRITPYYPNLCFAMEMVLAFRSVITFLLESWAGYLQSMQRAASNWGLHSLNCCIFLLLPLLLFTHISFPFTLISSIFNTHVTSCRYWLEEPILCSWLPWSWYLLFWNCLLNICLSQLIVIFVRTENRVSPNSQNHPGWN